jgi:hypothetical protein
MKLCLSVEAHEWDIRSTIPDVKIAAMPLRQRVTQEAVHVARATYEMAKHAVADSKNCEQY